jgi:hypothetical protein
MHRSSLDTYGHKTSPLPVQLSQLGTYFAKRSNVCPVHIPSTHERVKAGGYEEVLLVCHSTDARYATGVGPPCGHRLDAVLRRPAITAMAAPEGYKGFGAPRLHNAL